MREFHYDGFRVEVLANPGNEWAECERDLTEVSVPIPLPHRSVWARISPLAGYLFVAVRDGEGRCRCGFGVEVNRTRALPGHFVLRVERFGGTATAEARRAGVLALAGLARENWRVLRLHIEIFSRDAQARAAIGRDLSACGFGPAKLSRCYSRTVAVDLSPREEDIFASLHSTCRRHIRAANKKPVEVRPIEDPSLADRMDALVRETMARTGGAYRYQDWRSVVSFSKSEPRLSRLVGLFRTNAKAAESLMAFAWGCGHGDVCHYSTAASTRKTDLRIPLAYGLAWDLIRWAKRQGANWFDFGGITDGTNGERDPLGGISDFKRYFSTEVVEVGEEWVLEPRPFRSLLGRTISRAAQSVRFRLL